jgi:ABC-type uncharacterized transport system substrate-binding protein
MRRREALGVIGGAAIWSSATRAQPTKKLPLIGFLATGPTVRGINSFKQGMGELGYVEGANFVLEYRHAESRVDRFPALADELVTLRVDVIVATNSLAARAVRQVTSTIPVVVPVMGDPVGDGLVVSLARPGGNITGLTFLGPELLPKRLALLKEALPAASRVAGLWHPGAYGEPTMNNMLQRAEGGAQMLGVTLQLAAVHGPDEFASAFSKIVGQRADALLVFPSPMLFTELRRISDLVSEHRLPAMAMGREFAEYGGLMAYGASLADLHRRGALYVDKILKGANPGDLPVEQPSKFEFLINLKTAEILGVVLPRNLLAQADEVIE